MQERLFRVAKKEDIDAEEGLSINRVLWDTRKELEG